MPSSADENQLQPALIGQIVESVFLAMLGLETSAGNRAWFLSADRLIAEVHLEGSWRGTVRLECDRSQASRFTRRFLSVEPEDATEQSVEVVTDLLGELVNMIAGNLKCLLTPGVVLSMPHVRERCAGSSPEDEAGRLSFQCVDGVFWTTVVALPA